MFSTLGLFGNLLCPEGEACPYKKCLFSHDFPKPAKTSDDREPTLKRRRADSNAAEPDEMSLSMNGNQERKILPLKSALTKTTKPQPVNPRKRERSVSPPKVQTKTQPKTLLPTSNGKSKTVTMSKPADSLPLSAGLGSMVLDSPKPVVKAEPLIPRPMKNPPATIPMRFKLLKLVHADLDRLNKLLIAGKQPVHRPYILSDQEVITLALDEEANAATRDAAIYPSILKHRTMALRGMNLGSWIIERKTQLEKNRASPPNKKRKIVDTNERFKTGLTTKQEIAILPHLAASTKALIDHGHIVTIPTYAEVLKARAGVEIAHHWEVCDRCGCRFQAYPARKEDGTITTGGACRHHWGRLGPVSRGSNATATFTCCGLPHGEPGCEIKPAHVFKVTNPARLASILQFEETPTPSTTESLVPIAFDCEMAYTSYGMELIRLTAAAWPSGDRLLDVLVRPKGEVLDLNTRFSGVTVDQWTESKLWKSFELPPVASPKDDTDSPSTECLPMVPSISHARSLLFNLLSPTTPLIGHALENDLLAVRIIHPKIVDSVILYPHKRGLPVRNKLKFLVKDEINWTIQASEKEGHDSLEDALAAGELVRKKVALKWILLKNSGWSFDGDENLVAPGLRS